MKIEIWFGEVQLTQNLKKNYLRLFKKINFLVYLKYQVLNM